VGLIGHRALDTAARFDHATVGLALQPQTSIPALELVFQWHRACDTEVYMNESEILQEAVRRIRDGFQPQRLILFGSRAQVDARPDSDFDFVVLFDAPPDVHALAGKIRLALRDLPAAFDIIVRDAAQWERWASVPVTLQHRISREGKTVYDRAA